MDDSDGVKLFVGNLAVETTQDDLIALFAPYGKLETITLLRQFAFVHLQGEGAADCAIRSLNGIEFRGRSLVVEESRGRPQNSIKVYVGNLSALCTTAELHELFSRFGNVLECEKVKSMLPLLKCFDFSYVIFASRMIFLISHMCSPGVIDLQHTVFLILHFVFFFSLLQPNPTPQ